MHNRNVHQPLQQFPKSQSPVSQTARNPLLGTQQLASTNRNANSEFNTTPLNNFSNIRSNSANRKIMYPIRNRQNVNMNRQNFRGVNSMRKQTARVLFKRNNLEQTPNTVPNNTNNLVKGYVSSQLKTPPADVHKQCGNTKNAQNSSSKPSNPQNASIPLKKGVAAKPNEDNMNKQNNSNTNRVVPPQIINNNQANINKALQPQNVGNNQGNVNKPIQPQNVNNNQASNSCQQRINSKQKINTNAENSQQNSVKVPTAAKPASPQKTNRPDNITEIYKRSGPIHRSDGDNVKQIVKNGGQKPENLTFQKVTQDLANIIKSFQRQIHEVPISKAQMEQVPSAMIQPKIKEFFKMPPSNPQPTSNNSNKSQQSDSKNKNANNLKSQPANVNKQSSLKSFSRSSINHHVRKYSSLTHQTLPTRSSSSSRKISNRSSSLFVDPLKQLKDEVQRAMRERKTFTVRGQFAPIRKALLARGWVEKYHISYKDHLNSELKRFQNYTISELLPLMRKEDLTAVCKNLIKSKLLGAYQVDFYWGISYEGFKENSDKVKLTMMNKLKRDIFSYTNKIGLCDASKSSYWYQKSDVSKLNHPRSYSLGKNGDLKSFIQDFNITAAISLLKWVVKMHTSKECKVMSPFGKIPLETFDFALNECCKFIKKGRHEDIDVQIPEATEHEWNQFLDYFYKIVHYNNHFKAEGKETEESLVRKSNYILNTVKSFYPYVDMDGMMNIWILKPSASSRGRGIHMCRTLQYVLKVVKQYTNVRYIIQKYIERPLLIYNTKFDIRQWFLISNCSPLTIWMYKESYLRFSSQTYNLRKLHESIHLTNNSVQCKYKNNSLDAALPSYNMWDSNEFEKYLSNIGYPNAFKNIIYPGMKQCITAAVLMHQDKMVIRKNCFELYGADFILTEDFQPWLLEINSNPALYGSTPITARMCPKVLEDVIKVVIDSAHNSKANTGSFELVYKQQMTKLPNAAANFEVKGTPLQSSYFFNAPEELTEPTNYPAKPVLVDQAQDYLKTFGEEIKKTLKDLLQIIHNEKQKRGLEEQQNKSLCVA